MIFILVLVFALMEGVSWMAFRSAPESVQLTPEVADQADKVEITPRVEPKKVELAPISNFSPSAPPTRMGGGDEGSFPPPRTEVVNGRTERTIHMGVRKYVWEPATITAKKGELVRLIIHNADVQHGLVIPDLGVMNRDIPEDGAVIEFMASKRGAFEFFCSYYCGEGHIEMRGKIIIE